MKFTVSRSIGTQQRLSRKIITQDKSIALVPTMGFLHQGHLSLIRRGLRKADIVVTSIFVNPAQFAPHEDFNQYPRDHKSDLQKIRSAGGQIVFMPKASDIYPVDYETYVTVENMTGALEGKSRPTHFRGVTTIVAQLFNIIRPDFALFGMKDYQQAMVLKKMCSDLNWPIKMIIVPTLREKDGLAMSSRNKYLSPLLRAEAPALYQSLLAARQSARRGETGAAAIRRQMKRLIDKAAPSGKIDYIAFTEMESLIPVRRVDKNTVVSLAVKLGPIRLIDNLKIA
ncbi:MAG: pantoate--beta-alanine ligase [FCB group bacterium]|nr:pantoate--beta-alanine ligase [FCB group bacterium]